MSGEAPASRPGQNQLGPGCQPRFGREFANALYIFARETEGVFGVELAETFGKFGQADEAMTV